VPCDRQPEDPLRRQFWEYARYLVDHPPPEPMLWVLVEVLKETADLVAVLEERRRKEVSR